MIHDFLFLKLLQKKKIWNSSMETTLQDMFFSELAKEKKEKKNKKN